MPSQWFYRAADSSIDERVGPLTSTQLLTLAQQGKLRPTDVVWNCPEPPHTCEVEASLASNEQIAAFMHALEDNPQAEVDEIPTIYLQQLRSTEEGEKHFTLVLELP